MSKNLNENSIVTKIKKLKKYIDKKSTTDRLDKIIFITLSVALVIVVLAIVSTKLLSNYSKTLDDENVVQEYSHTNEFQLRTYGEDLTKNMENTDAPQNEATPVSCWGDSYMVAGNSTIPSLPAYISKYANRIVYNVSVPEDSLEMLAARQGGLPMYISPCDIKREKAPIEVSFTNAYGSTLLPSLTKNGGLNPCTVNGVEGVVYQFDGKYYFTRSASGNEEIITDAQTEVVTKAMSMRRGDISIFFVGDDDVFATPEKAVEIYTKMTEYLETDKYLIVGPVCGNKADVDATNAALESAFGDKYFNLLNYLCTDAVDEYSLSLSEDDANIVKTGQLTAGYFLADGYFSNDINEISGHAIYQKITDLGYFDN